MSDEWSKASNTQGERVSNVTVSVQSGEGASTFVFVHRGKGYCHVIAEPTQSSVLRVQRAQRVMSERGKR